MHVTAYGRQRINDRARYHSGNCVIFLLCLLFFTFSYFFQEPFAYTLALTPFPRGSDMSWFRPILCEGEERPDYYLIRSLFTWLQ
jgi:hypothetical protein